MVRGWFFAALLCGMLLGTSAWAADLSAEQSAAAYDLMRDVGSDAPKGADADVYKRALDILKKERLAGGSRPNYHDKGRLENLGKALTLPGPLAKKYAKSIAAIDELISRHDDEALKQALQNVWKEAGRGEMSEDAMKPILDSIQKLAGTAPSETVNYTVDKETYRVDLTHAREGERVKLVVSQKNDKGEIISRTVFQGHRKSKVNARGDDIERMAVLDRVCVNTPQTDKLVADALMGEWTSPNSKWTITNNADGLTLTDDRGGNPHPYIYKSSFKLGAIEGAHSITHPDELSPALPLAVRQQLAGQNHTYRIHLEHCPDTTGKLEGTWSSQHVTYDGMFMTVKRVHDPYDVGLSLRSKNFKQEYQIVKAETDYTAFKKRMTAEVERLGKISAMHQADIEKQRGYIAKNTAQIAELNMKMTEQQKQFAEALDPKSSEALVKAMDETRKDKLFLEDVIEAERNNITKLLRKLASVEALTERVKVYAELSEEDLPASVPAVLKLRVMADGSKVFEQHRNIAKVELAKFETIESFFKKQLAFNQEMHAQALEQLEKLKSERKNQVDAASEANQKVQAAYNNVSDFVEKEAWTRWIVHTLSDVAEIFAEGKGLHGALFESMNKLGEAYFTSGIGKSFEMYSPDSLIGKASMKELLLSQRDAVIPTKKDDAINQAQQSLYGAATDVLKYVTLGTKELQEMRKVSLAQTERILAETSGDLADASKLAGAYDKMLTELLTSEEMLRSAASQAVSKAEREALEASRREMVSLAEQVMSRTVFRITRANLLQDRLSHFSKEVAEEVAQGRFVNALKGLDASFVKKMGVDTAKGVGRGLVWDGIRLAFHKGMDKVAEEQWTAFMNTLFEASLTNKILRRTNEAIATMETVVSNQRGMVIINQTQLGHVRLLKERYKKESGSRQPMHTLIDSAIGKNTGRVEVELEIIRSQKGEAVLLGGDLKRVTLRQGDSHVPDTEIGNSTSIIEGELGQLEHAYEDREDGSVHAYDETVSFYLPDDMTLEDLSSTGKLTITTEIQ